MRERKHPYLSDLAERRVGVANVQLTLSHTRGEGDGSDVHVFVSDGHSLRHDTA